MADVINLKKLFSDTNMILASIPQDNDQIVHQIDETLVNGDMVESQDHRGAIIDTLRYKFSGVYREADKDKAEWRADFAEFVVMLKYYIEANNKGLENV